MQAILAEEAEEGNFETDVDNATDNKADVNVIRQFWRAMFLMILI